MLCLALAVRAFARLALRPPRAVSPGVHAVQAWKAAHASAASAVPIASIPAPHTVRGHGIQQLLWVPPQLGEAGLGREL